MKDKPKIRVSKTGLMGSATKVHKPKKGPGSYERQESKKRLQREIVRAIEQLDFEGFRDSLKIISIILTRAG